MHETETTGLSLTPLARRLKQMIGARVEVATWSGTLHGHLREVFADHILIENGAHYHVRLTAVAWVRQKAEPPHF